MSSNDNTSEERGDGAQAASSTKPRTPSSSRVSVADTGDNMKRAAAKQLIERYYYQLTDGCGSQDCRNEYCASSSTFRNVTNEQAALKAVELFKNKATLCDPSKPSKVAKSSCADESPTLSQSDSAVRTETNCTKKVAKQKACHSDGMEVSSPDPEAAKPGCSTSVHTSTKSPVEKTVLTEEKLKEIIEKCEKDESWTLLIRTLGSVYSNSESLMHSFCRQATKEQLRAMHIDPDKDTDEGDSAGATPQTSLHIAKPTKVSLKDDEVTVDIDAVRRSYAKLFAIPGQPFQASMINALVYLSKEIEMDLKFHQGYDRNPDYINIFLIVMEIPTLHSPEFLESATPHFCKVVGKLPVHGQAKLARLWAKYPRENLKQMVDSLQQLITVKVISTPWTRSSSVNDDDSITGAGKVMKILFFASMLGGQMDPAEVLEEERAQDVEADDSLQELLQGAVGREAKEKSEPRVDPLEKELGVGPINCRHPVIAFEDFVNEPLSDVLEMDRDYAYYKSGSDFNFMTHSFLLTTAVKNLGMYYDNRIRMMSERRASLLQSVVHGAPVIPYLRLRIRRDHVIDDALVSLEMAAMDNPQDLKKQLYVEFDGEQGIDEGGVSKEFFQLVVEEIFNPDIGMFTYDDETRSFWFNPTSFENDGQFTLIGIVLGLAIYNNVILDVHFPMVVYRKLLGKKGTFDDLLNSHPKSQTRILNSEIGSLITYLTIQNHFISTLAKSLLQLLEYEGDVESDFMQMFCIGYHDVFGASLTHNLKENGDQIYVTNENRKEFVDLYADFLLNKSIDKQFRAFQRGFHMVTNESPLKMLFRPEEVELLVCGSKKFDFHALQDAADYDGGFTQDCETIRNFWDIVQNVFTEDQKRKLLEFTTGSDRVPVGGLSKLRFTIARNGPDSHRLPTAHTCFNVLLLPEYSSKCKLQERLLKAINYAKGFGML